MSDANDGGERATTRRNALKLLSAAGAATFAVPGAADDGPTPVSTLPEPDAPVVGVADEMKELTNAWTLLTLDEDAVLRWMDRADADAAAVGAAKRRVTELRKDYPVEKVRTGTNRFEYRLAEDASAEVSRADREKFREAYRLHAQGAAGGMPGGDVGAAWKGTDHERHVSAVEGQMPSLSSSEASNLQDHVSEPDDYDHPCDCSSPVDVNDSIPYDGDIEQALADVPGKFAQKYCHYRDANLASFSAFGYTVDVGALGGAHAQTECAYNQAKNAYYEFNREENIAHALHYVQDMGNPLHVGMGREQAGLTFFDDGIYSFNPKNWLHGGFEALVRDHWYTDAMWDALKGEDPDDFPNWVYWPVESNGGPRAAVNALAEDNEDRAYTVYQKIMNASSQNYENWDYSRKLDLLDLARDALQREGIFLRGFLREFYA